MTTVQKTLVINDETLKNVSANIETYLHGITIINTHKQHVTCMEEDLKNSRLALEVQKEKFEKLFKHKEMRTILGIFDAMIAASPKGDLAEGVPIASWTYNEQFFLRKMGDGFEHHDIYDGGLPPKGLLDFQSHVYLPEDLMMFFIQKTRLLLDGPYFEVREDFSWDWYQKIQTYPSMLADHKLLLEKFLEAGFFIDGIDTIIEQEEPSSDPHGRSNSRDVYVWKQDFFLKRKPK